MNLAYSLAATTHACEFRQAVILLDVAGDRYLRIAGAQADLFREIARGPNAGTKAAKYAAYLQREGLIVEGADGKPLTGGPARAGGTPTSPCVPEKPKVNAADVFRFVRSLRTARQMRRRTGLHTVFETVTEWKSQSKPAGPVQVAARAATFHAMEPFFFSARDACFFRSLALLRYLFLNGLTADWVFGVRDTPFEAHCWLESGSYILNDAPDHTAAFNRILTV